MVQRCRFWSNGGWGWPCCGCCKPPWTGGGLGVPDGGQKHTKKQMNHWRVPAGHTSSITPMASGAGDESTDSTEGRGVRQIESSRSAAARAYTGRRPSPAWPWPGAVRGQCGKRVRGRAWQSGAGRRESARAAAPGWRRGCCGRGREGDRVLTFGLALATHLGG